LTRLPVQQVLLDSIAVIDRLGLRYAVMGGFAARFWGLPRPTYDADIAVAVSPSRINERFDAFDEAGFEVPPEHRTGFLDNLQGLQKAKLSRFAHGHVWRTDLFVVGEGDLLQSAVIRAIGVLIDGTSVQMMTAEDIVLLKLLAGRRKDLADIDDILLVCGELDRTYLDHWASRLGVTESLAEFLP
jgi:hypothetical protein